MATSFACLQTVRFNLVLFFTITFLIQFQTSSYLFFIKVLISPITFFIMETEQKSIRALKCEQSVLSRADGSVMFSQGIKLKSSYATFIP